MDQKTLERVLGRFEVLATGSDGSRWLELLHRLKCGETPRMEEMAMVDELVDLDMCKRDSSGLTLTSFGSKCADSAREYLFWTQRDRRLPHEGIQPIVLENFRDKDVLEIGPGWGCNLIPISTVARRAVGLEIEPVYVEFSRILARRERASTLEIRHGAAENIPFRGEEFDWVLLVSVLSYIDPQAAFGEIKRVLRRGGFALITQSTLPEFIRYRLRQSRNPRALLTTASIVVNTLWYQRFGRRLRENIEGNSTARPIHPTKAFLVAAAARAGLRFRVDLSTPLGNEFVFVFQNQS